ncbi:hypothetical protein AX17_003853 [Amanita inopinata Kibby_2008]|nr:hypothetical protein AX17_003853 [Amanita inopinata Kibby_2008]
MWPVPNIILFGETGAGKSSVVNLIVGENVAPISSRSVGCTFKSNRYTAKIDQSLFFIHDTAGLDEGQTGTVPREDAIVQLYQLLRNLESGVNLLIFCMRAPRIKESCYRNWRLFREIICRDRVPIVLAITGLEAEDNMDDWWRREKMAFTRYEMFPHGVACLTATRGKEKKGGRHLYDEEYEESREKIRTVLQENCLVNAWSVPPTQWFTEIVEVTYKQKLFGLCPPERIEETRTVVGRATQDLVSRCEMSAEEAHRLAERLKGT